MGLGAGIGGALAGLPGAIGGSFVQRALSRRPQESSPAAPAPGQSDLLDPAAIARRQRAARRMSDGVRDTYATSTRGTEGESGAGLRGPPQSGDDLPIIDDMDGRPLPTGVRSVDDQAAYDEQQRRLREARADAPIPTRSGGVAGRAR